MRERATRGSVVARIRVNHGGLVETTMHLLQGLSMDLIYSCGYEASQTGSTVGREQSVKLKGRAEVLQDELDTYSLPQNSGVSLKKKKGKTCSVSKLNSMSHRTTA